MSQHDMVVDNGPGLAVRTDINAAIQALVSLNAGPIEPTVKYAGMLWLDTTVAPDGLLWQRNQANTAWITPTVVPSTAGTIVLTVFTSSATWTKPAGLKYLEVTCVGGGGGGANTNSTAAGQSSASGGGGGGGTAIRLYAAADLSATEAYTVGAAGVNSTAGTAGGSTTFKGLTGGGGAGAAAGSVAGTTFSNTNRGIGGSASGGQFHFYGEYGESGIRSAHGLATAAIGGGGGRSFMQPGGTTVLTGGAGVGAQPGNIPGGGGGGAANGASQGATAGADGGQGWVILKEIF